MAVVPDAGGPLSPQPADLVRRVARVVLDEAADLLILECDSRPQVPVSAEGADVHTRWLFSRMKTSRSNNRTAHSAEATHTALTRVHFSPCCGAAG